MRREIAENDVVVYKSTANDITVSVQPHFLDDESSPTDHHYVWAYKVRIENLTKESLKLTARLWQITDANGASYEVSGEGVVGQKPVIKAGEQFEYTSMTHLPTASGVMQGFYRMESCPEKKTRTKKTKKPLVVCTPLFSLDSPEQVRYPN